MRIQLALVGLVLAPFANCTCEDPLSHLAPKIEIGDPYDPAFSVCAKDFVRECAFDFGNVPLAQGKFFSFMIKNQSPADLLIRAITIEGSGAAAFAFEGDLPSVVESNIGTTGKMVTVKFAPSTVTSFDAVVRIASNAENLVAGELVEIHLTASGIDNGSPDIDVTPPQCDFGAVGVGGVAYCDLSVNNVGVRELQLTDASITNQAVFGSQDPLIIPLFIQAGLGQSIRLYARPTDTSLQTGTLVLTSTDPDEPSVTVPLSVQGAQAPTAIGRVKTINGINNSAATPQVEPLDDVVVSGDQSTPGLPGGSITAYAWTLIEQPSDSTVVLSNPSSRDTGFQFSSASGTVHALDVVGTYVVSLTVTDNTGAVSSNDARVTLNAIPTEGLHVQLTWDVPSDDIDLHVARNNNPDWCSINDCYFANCVGSGLNWDGVGGTAGDPSLDIDDLSGYGPENTNIDTPINGKYTVGVYFYSGFEPTSVTAKIFLGGALAWEGSGQISPGTRSWTAAAVDVNNGVSTVTPIEQTQSTYFCN